MDLVEAVVLGVVQGLTEWIPISSTAHLRIVPALAGWPDPGAAFTAVIQLGTLAAVLVYFWKDLKNIAVSWGRSLVAGPIAKTPESQMGWAILAGTVPVVVLGLIFSKQIKTELRSLNVIAYALILMGIVMWIADRYSGGRKRLKDVKPASGWVVGLWQALALIPGVSRSGSTISGARFLGFDRPIAARFSFLLSIPSVLGAGLLELWQERKEIVGPQLAPTLVATVVSFGVGYLSIKYFMQYLQRHSLIFFVLYRIALGVLILVLLSKGTLKPLDHSKPQSVVPERSHVILSTQASHA